MDHKDLLNDLETSNARHIHCESRQNKETSAFGAILSNTLDSNDDDLSSECSTILHPVNASELSENFKTEFKEEMVKVELKEEVAETDIDSDFISNDAFIENNLICDNDSSGSKEDNKTSKIQKKRRWNYNKKCPFCEKQFNDGCELKYHIFSHTGEKPFVCDVCQQCFNNPRALKRHMLLHKDKTIPCHHCPKRFSDQSLLDLHLKYVGLSFPCDICGNVYARKENLKSHLRKHTGETPYECSFCEAKFNMSYKLKEHVNSKHLHVEKQLFVCEFCGKEYKKKSDLNEHANTHTGDPTSRCALCQETFNTKTAYREHTNIHNKKFECQDCGKCFGNARNLDRHEKAHNGIKDFQCSVCAKPYTSFRSLQKHMEIKHDIIQGKKQTFTCEICNRSYTRADYLERHLNKHNI